MVPRLKEKYFQEIVPKLKADFGIKNTLALPCLEKIVVNMGVGKAKEDKKALEDAVRDLAIIAGQQPAVTTAKKAVASFRLRQGMQIGCKVTLRKERMYEFLDRLISIAMPRLKDFRGVSGKSFDQSGNYTIGLSDQTIFPEISVDRLNYVQGMDVTIVIRRSDPEKSKALLSYLGMPFSRN